MLFSPRGALSTSQTMLDEEGPAETLEEEETDLRCFRASDRWWFQLNEGPRCPQAEWNRAATSHTEMLLGCRFSVLLQLCMLFTAFMMAYLIKRTKFHYLQPAGAFMLLGVVVGCAVEFSKVRRSPPRWCFVPTGTG